MAPLVPDLNLDVDPPIDWEVLAIGKDLLTNYTMTWCGRMEEKVMQGEHGVADARSNSVHGGSGTGDGGTNSVHGGSTAGDGGTNSVHEGSSAGDGGTNSVNGGSSANDGGSNVKKRRFYPDDLKIAISLELLALTKPPVLERGVSKHVSQKFDVPLKVVQTIWRNGQDYGGIDGVVNKLVKNCGHKNIEIDMEAIKSVDLKDRTTFHDLANALGVKKSTLHNWFKE
ncbi:hypothetical protein BS78_04G164900 [Paspalum vaginatum]|nr:hypothetical protein BS78_04G164900 [Paspalum vaginatum]